MLITTEWTLPEVEHRWRIRRLVALAPAPQTAGSLRALAFASISGLGDLLPCGTLFFRLELATSTAIAAVWCRGDLTAYVLVVGLERRSTAAVDGPPDPAIDRRTPERTVLRCD